MEENICTDNNSFGIQKKGQEERYLTNMRYVSTNPVNKNINSNTMNNYVMKIINDPKYSDKKSSNSPFSKKPMEEKFEIMGLKGPSKKWRCDPTADILIQKLEQKVDVLYDENWILVRKLKQLLSHSKQLQTDLNNQNFLFSEVNDDFLKNSNKKEEKDIDAIEELNKAKIANMKLKEEIENISAINIELNKTINKLENDINNLKNKYENLLRKYDNDLNQLKNKNKEKKPENDNSFVIKEERYKRLLKENEKLHQKLKELLRINNYNDNNKDEENENYYNELINNDDNNIKKIKRMKGSENNRYSDMENLFEENLLLKKEIINLKNQLSKMSSQKIEALDNEEDNINNNNNELDLILNETIKNIKNTNDEESKKMISVIESIKNNDKKRISQCLIIGSRLKNLTEENNLLNSQIMQLRRGDLPIFGSVSLCNVNNDSYDYLINELKNKDKIIETYLQKNNETEKKYRDLIIENNFLSNKNLTMEKEINVLSRSVQRPGNKYDEEENLIGSIIYNQNKVLENREPINNYNYNNNYHYEEINKNPPKSAQQRFNDKKRYYNKK